MSKPIITIDEVMDLAFAYEEKDPINWEQVRGNKEPAMRMIAATVIEQFQQDTGLSPDEEKIIMIAAITKLTTENMLLYTELMTLKK